MTNNRRSRPAAPRLCKFLDAMLSGAMHQHPEFVQAVGHATLRGYAEQLCQLGWDVKMRELPASPSSIHRESVAYYYIDDDGIDAASLEDFDD